MFTRWKASSAALALACIIASPARAVSERDLEVIARALEFVPGVADEGVVDVAVIVDPSNAISAAEGREVARLMAGVRGPSRAALSPREIAIDDISQIARVDLAFVTRGLGPLLAQVFEVASKNGVMTVSTDPRCIDAGWCVMWVRAEPTVQIVVHRAAADASSVRLRAAFRMLITER